MDNTNYIELLLERAPAMPEKQLEMKRLSKELGVPVMFRIRAVSYSHVVNDILGKPDAEVMLVLDGLVSPNIKDQRLLAKFGAPTPAELLRDARFLRPGEVMRLAKEIERLSGFGDEVFEEITKN